MSLVKWSPITELEDMRNEVDRLFGNWFEPFPGRLLHRHPEPGVFVPRVDMFEKNGNVIVKADLPGVQKENIELSISKDGLTIKGEIRKEEEVKEKNYYSLERNYGSFTRTIPLNDEVDSNKAKAVYKNGVLEIVLPKKEEAKPKAIKVDVN